MALTPQQLLAKRLFDVIPPVLHLIRMEFRAVAKGTITVPQLRILAHIEMGLQQVCKIAELHGVSQPAMSRMVDGLVKRHLLERSLDVQDRRQWILKLTNKGASLLQEMRSRAQVRLGGKLKHLNVKERARLMQGLDEIEQAFLIAETEKNATT